MSDSAPASSELIVRLDERFDGLARSIDAISGRLDNIATPLQEVQQRLAKVEEIARTAKTVAENTYANKERLAKLEEAVETNKKRTEAAHTQIRKVERNWTSSLIGLIPALIGIATAAIMALTRE